MQICLRNKWRCAVFWSSTDSPIDCIYWDLKGNFSSMTAARQITYLSRITKFRFPDMFFTHIQVMCLGFLFSQPRYIYKDYFKGHFTLCNWLKKVFYAYCDRKQFALVHLSLEEATAFVRRRVLWSRSFLIFIVGMNWKTLYSTSFLSWCVSHILGSVHRLVSHVLGAMH